MLRTPLAVSLSVSLVSALVFSFAPARADEGVADRCISSLDHALLLRKAGKLRESRDALVKCSSDACPREVTSECVAHLGPLKVAIPRIIFDARTERGQDLSSVVVTMDGEQLVSTLNGTAIEIDPGEHQFVFTAAGLPPLIRTFVIHEADRERREVIVLSAAIEPASSRAPLAVVTPVTPPPPAAGAGDSGSHSGWGAGKVGGVALMSAGVAGLAVGGGFGIATMIAVHAQHDSCSSNGCSNRSAAQNDHDASVRNAWVSDIALGVGAALAVTGAVVFLKAPKAEAPEGTSVSLIPAASPGLYGLWLRGGF